LGGAKNGSGGACAAKKTEEGRQETENGRQETGKGRQETEEWREEAEEWRRETEKATRLAFLAIPLLTASTDGIKGS
jgi:hypothetical protein